MAVLACIACITLGWVLRNHCEQVNILLYPKPNLTNGKRCMLNEHGEYLRHL